MTSLLNVQQIRRLKDSFERPEGKEHAPPIYSQPESNGAGAQCDFLLCKSNFSLPQSRTTLILKYHQYQHVLYLNPKNRRDSTISWKIDIMITDFLPSLFLRKNALI